MKTDPYKDEAQAAADALRLQAITRICNECSHRWVADQVTGTTCPECQATDSITEADLLANQAENGLHG